MRLWFITKAYSMQYAEHGIVNTVTSCHRALRSTQSWTWCRSKYNYLQSQMQLTKQQLKIFVTFFK